MRASVPAVPPAPEPHGHRLPLEREVGESLLPEKVHLFCSSEARTFPTNMLYVHSVAGGHRLLPYDYKEKNPIFCLNRKTNE